MCRSTFSRSSISAYKDIRHIIQFGDLYRLRSPQAETFSALEYVSQDQKEAVLFAFCTHQPFTPNPEALPPIHLRGLNPSPQYTVEGCEGVRSGLTWMRTGIDVMLSDYQNIIRRIRQGTDINLDHMQNFCPIVIR